MTDQQILDLLVQKYGTAFLYPLTGGESQNTLQSRLLAEGVPEDTVNRFVNAWGRAYLQNTSLTTALANPPAPVTATVTAPRPPRYTATAPTPQPTGTLSAYTGLPEFTPTTSATGYQAPTIPMGGATEDQINYLSNLRRLATQDQMARLQSQQQRSEIATAYEPQIRKAGREMYNQQVKAQASLGARGISGAPGLSVAARRAAMAAPAMQRTSLISDRNRQLAALERTLTSQLSSYEEEIRRNQEQLTRATTLANQLTGTGK